MFDSPFFDSVISMITLYLIFSQLTLSLVELSAGVWNWRGNFLYKNLEKVLGETARDAFYASPAIKGLMSPTKSVAKAAEAWPAYVSETLFAQTIITWVSGLDSNASSLSPIAKFQAGLNNLDATAAATVAVAQADAKTVIANAQSNVTTATTDDPAADKALTLANDTVRAANDQDSKAAAEVTVINDTNEKGRTANAPKAAEIARTNVTNEASDKVNAAIAAEKEAKNFTLLLRPLCDAALAAAAAEPEQSQALQKNLEAWFHEYGERMTGWYKRDNRIWLFFAGLLVAVLADVDTVRLARFISDSSNAKARTALVAAGAQAAQGTRPMGLGYQPTSAEEASAYNKKEEVTTWNSVANQASNDLKKALDAVPQVGLPLGFVRWADRSSKEVYKKDTTTILVRDTTTILKDTTINGQKVKKHIKNPRRQANKRIFNPKTAKDSVSVGYRWKETADDFGMPTYAQRWKLDKATGDSTSLDWTWLKMIGGWLLTAFAMMLGAPFWFDTLCRFVNIRNVGIKPARADKT